MAVPPLKRSLVPPQARQMGSEEHKRLRRRKTVGWGGGKFDDFNTELQKQAQPCGKGGIEADRFLRLNCRLPNMCQINNSNIGFCQRATLYEIDLARNLLFHAICGAWLLSLSPSKNHNFDPPVAC